MITKEEANEIRRVLGDDVYFSIPAYLRQTGFQLESTGFQYAENAEMPQNAVNLPQNDLTNDADDANGDVAEDGKNEAKYWKPLVSN